MEYGDVLYCGSKGRLLAKLQSAQNRILRLCIYSNVYIETEMLYSLCKTTKLELRREVHLNLFMYKQKGNNKIVNNSRDIHTRAHDALLYTTVKPKNEKYNQNIYYRGALIWNSLPPIERDIETFKKFKEKQKLKLL